MAVILSSDMEKLMWSCFLSSRTPLPAEPVTFTPGNSPQFQISTGIPWAVHKEGPWGGGAEGGVADFRAVLTTAPVMLDDWNLTRLRDPQQQGERSGSISVVQAGCPWMQEQKGENTLGQNICSSIPVSFPALSAPMCSADIMITSGGPG